MKKLISLIIAAVLVLSALPVYAEITVPEAAKVGYQEDCDTVILFENGAARINGEGAAAGEGCINITASGSYLISGSFEGTVNVDVADEKKVELCLNGFMLDGVINVISAPKKVTLKACYGSVNVIKYTAAETEETTAAVYAKADLQLSGEGELYVYSPNNRGVFSSDDISIKDVTLYVISGENGIHGKDSVEITGGTVTVEAGKDGIKSTNSKNEEKGYVDISGGEISIVSVKDGIQAETSVSISGGEISILSGGGYTASTKTHQDEFGGHGERFGGKPPMMPEEQNGEEKESGSYKGIKAGTNINVSGGDIVIDSNDDGMNAGAGISVSGGNIVISTGDDAMHADSLLDISGGVIDIRASYEGFESAEINISGGENRVTSSDDGISASGDSEEDETASNPAARGFGGHGGFGGNGIGSLNISGGYTLVNALGDGVDSNNSVTMSGGTLIVNGPVNNMNSAIDYENSFAFSGGMVIASGADGMAQSVSTDDDTAVLAFRLPVKAEELVTIADSEGNEIMVYSSPREYACLVFAGDMLIKGESYSVYLGGTNSGTAKDGIYTGGKTENGVLVGTCEAR